MQCPCWFKRLMQALLVLCMILALAVVLLPSLIASRRMQAVLISRVNRELAAGQHVSWAQVSFGWFGEQRIENLVYHDESVAVTVDAVSIEKGLLSFIGRNINIGSITVERPNVTVTLPARLPDDDTEPSDQDVSLPPARETDRRTDKPEAGKEDDVVIAELPTFRMPVELKGQIHVRDGYLQVGNAAETQAMIWENMQTQVLLSDGLRQGVDIQFTADQRHSNGPGNVSLTASLRMLQADGSFDPHALLVETALALQNVQIGAVTWIPHELVDAPMVEGLLDAHAGLTVRGVDLVSLDHAADISDLIVFGGPLGADRLDVGNISMQAKALWQDRVLRLETLRVDNAFVQLQGDGLLDAAVDASYPAGRMRFELKTDVARAIAQLPGMIPLHEGMVLEDGTFHMEMLLDSDGEELALAGEMALPRVQVRHDDRVLAFDDFLVAQLALKLTAAGPEISNVTLRTPFANIEGQGNLDALRIRADVDLDAARETAAQFVDLGSQVLEGSVTLEGNMVQSAPAVRSLQITTGSPGIRIGISEEQIVSLGKLHFEAVGDVHFADDGVTPLRASGLRAILQSDPVTVSATAADLDITTVPPTMPVGNLQWEIDFGHIHALLAAAGMLEDEVSMAGQFRGAAGIALQDAVLTVSPFEGEVTQLRLTAPDFVFEDPSMTMQSVLSVALPPASPSVTVRNAKVKSSVFSLQVPALHILMPEGELPQFSLQQTLLTADLGGLMPIVQHATGAPIEMEGESTVTFSWEGPIDPNWEDMVRHSRGDADIRVPRVKAYGMLTTNMVATMQAQDGRIHLSIDTAANDGRVVMEPVMDVTGAYPLLIIPDDTHAIRGVTLTDEMASELLGLVHPLLRGSSILGGTVNLTLAHCRIPLSEDGMQGADLSGIFVLRDLEFESSGTLLRVLETARLGAQRIRVPEQELAFHVADGRIHGSPLTLGIAGHALTLAGSVGLDTSLDYSVQVPLTAELVGRDAYRMLEGRHLALAIGGTAMRPEIARDAFTQAAALLVQDAMRSAIRDEGREAVRDLQERGEDAFRDLLRRRR